MVSYQHTKSPVLPEGIARAKVKSAEIRKRRDPDEWKTTVDTLVVELAAIHYEGIREVVEDAIPITRKRAWRIDQLRVAAGEELSDDNDPARYEWDEQTIVGKELYLWFAIWETEKKKKGNAIEYLHPDNAEVFHQAVAELAKEGATK